MAGLVSDPARQAKDTFRGYIFQILRSILVWLDLGDDEKLFLEGAEDLDRIDDTGALTEQIKDTAGSGNITLRTASVVDAINNFWAHRMRNPSVTIRYRYVTTSCIGVEQGSLFDRGQLPAPGNHRLQSPSHAVHPTYSHPHRHAGTAPAASAHPW